MRHPYHTCPKCGSHLDFGETCDCNVDDKEKSQETRSDKPKELKNVS